LTAEIEGKMDKEKILSCLNPATFWQVETGAVLRQGENLIRSPLRGDDRKPSFSVNTDTGLWHDFGTGAGGDVFSYVMQKHGLDFPGALQYVERFTGAAVSRPKPLPKPAPIRQGTRENYGILEVVQGAINNRGHFEARACTPDYFSAPGAVESYHSMYWHCGAIETYQREHGNIKGYCGPVWCRELFFDIDFKDSTQAENIGRALNETRKLIQKIKGLGVSTFSIKFSGNKGFHISFSCPALDDLSGYVDTPARVKSLVEKLTKGIDGLDFTIYGTATHLIRSLNSINQKSGLHAIPFSEAEIYSLSPEEIIALAGNPRPQPKEFKPVRFHSRLLNEDGTIYADRCVFDSGAVFNQQELDLLEKDKNKQNIKAVYLIKKSFGGNVEKGKK
jgi:hypothetical protein